MSGDISFCSRGGEGEAGLALENIWCTYEYIDNKKSWNYEYILAGYVFFTGCTYISKVYTYYSRIYIRSRKYNNNRRYTLIAGYIFTVGNIIITGCIQDLARYIQYS
jgi:hypothetical protein